MLLTDLNLSEAEAAELGDLLRSRIPEVAEEAALAIERQLPALVRPHDPRFDTFLRQSVDWGIGRFIELIAGGDARIEELCAFYRDIGGLIAEEGIAQDDWQASFRVSAGVAIDRMTESASAFPGVTPSSIAKVAQGVLEYLEQITGAMVEGYREGNAAADVLQCRRKLLEHLLTEDPDAETVHRLCAEASWPVPKTIAVVALRRRGDLPVHLRPPVPMDALPGLHLPEPCLIVADPDGPGRRERLDNELRSWIAAVGPTVEPTRAARSLVWARRGLDLAVGGRFSTQVPLRTGDHAVPLALLHGSDLMAHLAAVLLAPLSSIRDSHRARLAETLLLCLQCGFNAAEVAHRLHLHPQTIRYRIRQLEELFGPTVHDPERNLDFQAALTYWFTTPAAESS